MSRRTKAIWLAAAAAGLALPGTAMAGTKDFALQGYALPADKPVTVVLMRPAVDVGELQVGGLAEPNADWTAQARTNIEAALRAELAGRDIAFVSMDEQLGLAAKRQAALEASCAAARAAREDALAKAAAANEAARAAPVVTGADVAPAAAAQPIVVVAPDLPGDCLALAKLPDHARLIADYEALHEAVIGSIIAHKYGLGEGKLPTKKEAFEYTLGPGTGALGAVAGANYGLFVMTNDQFASSGRKAMQVVGALGCLIGVCTIVKGGTHVGYVSLVELETGNLVWFNLLRGSKGDVRESGGAADLVKAIMAGMPARPGELASPATASR